MASKRRTLRFVPFEAERFRDRWMLAALDEPDLTVGQLLRELPALSLAPLTADHLELRVAQVTHELATADPDTPLYLPPGMTIEGLATAAPVSGPAVPAAGPPRPVVAAGLEHPDELSERQAVLIAHDLEINRAAAYLENGLSVLIRCEKLLVEHLAEEIAGRSGRPVQPIRAAGTAAPDLPGLAPSRRAELLAAMQAAVAQAAPGDVLVVPYLDLLAGGTDAALSSEAREITEALYERAECVLLGFIDPSLNIPEVLASRFAVRLGLDILPREVAAADGGRVPLGRALVTRAEAGMFEGFDAVGLYKHIAGMNAVRLRHALRFASQQHAADGAGTAPGRQTFADLLREVRIFKVRTSNSFEVPNVDFGAIGGYDDVKSELRQAMDIIGGAADLPDHLRHELVPRGFIFHGPPGTGKTLFAKAIASKLGGTLLVVSGPEVTDMYVGESERKVRELFAEARRNAPAVVVFDEFDSIAAQRSGRDDGGSRAGNAVVAQLLTELDGFRAEVPVLIIGTTNRLDLIDEALLRPSRFRPIRIDLPDAAARVEIARWHAGHFGVPVTPALLEAIAAAAEGLNGDDIRSIFRDGRADELVGSRRPVDAYRLGELVGALRRARQQRDADRAGGIAARRPAGTRREAAVRVPLVPLVPPATTNPTAIREDSTP